jgi:molybdenum cofactor cytidylyltransferase
MTGIIILAAGSSSRMGSPKQQLVFQQETLLQHAIKAATGIQDAVVIVVVGANQEVITPGINEETILVVNNLNWEEGMASSIKKGIESLEVYSEVDSALLMLCDQPFVTSALLQQMIQLKTESDSPIVACAYRETIGAPVLFDISQFPELSTLQGQEGAKKVIFKHQDKVQVLPFENGGIDIDTPEDYQRLISKP